MIKCISCDYETDDVNMMEDHCFYLQHTGYIQEGTQPD